MNIKTKIYHPFLANSLVVLAIILNFVIACLVFPDNPLGHFSAFLVIFTLVLIVISVRRHLLFSYPLLADLVMIYYIFIGSSFTTFQYQYPGSLAILHVLLGIGIILHLLLIFCAPSRRLLWVFYAVLHIPFQLFIWIHGVMELIHDWL